MQCEKCGQEIETITCGSCGKPVTKLGPFCYLCGKALSEQAGAGGRVEQTGEDGEVADFSSRILCSDGACIGVVEHGVCKVCGKPYTPEQ
jgi:hypothetical protein